MIVAGLATILYFPVVFSDFSPDQKYLIQGWGFLSGKQVIFDSSLALQFTSGLKNGSAILTTLDNGIITIGDGHYLNLGTWKTSLLREGKFFVVVGDAQDTNGNLIHVNLFGRVIDSNQDGSLYSITGKITGSETMKVTYSAKLTTTNTITINPITNTTQTPPTQPVPPTQLVPSIPVMKTVQINILSGASNYNNGQFLTPSTLQIDVGTRVIWVNNDSIPHRILSGQILSTTQGSAGARTNASPHFIPDGRIDSNILAPGQRYQLTINNTGSIQFYDPSFTWINGIIISSSINSSGKPIQISIQPGSSIPQGSSSDSNQAYYNRYYSPSDIQIVPGTPILWINNDFIDHTILSGVSTQRPENPFTSDGRIVSDKIAPGQTFQVIVNGTGIIRFYDPQYTWMNGVIVSIPPSTSHIITAPSHNPGLH
jgi:plastocyanin